MTSVPSINALPTTYHGITFRSRTEARWAVYLDALGVEWEHEPQGYELGGVRYLPDFWLPQIDAFLEVKPTMGEGEQKAHLLCAATRKSVFVTGGPPKADKLANPPALIGFFIGFREDVERQSQCFFWPCPKCQRWNITDANAAIFHQCGCDLRGCEIDVRRFVAAAFEAMAYRFWNPGGAR